MFTFQNLNQIHSVMSNGGEEDDSLSETLAFQRPVFPDHSPL